MSEPCGDRMRNKIPALSAYGGEYSNVGTYPSVPSNLPEAGCIMITCRRHIWHHILRRWLFFLYCKRSSSRELEKKIAHFQACVSGSLTITLGEIDWVPEPVEACMAKLIYEVWACKACKTVLQLAVPKIPIWQSSEDCTNKNSGGERIPNSELSMDR